MSTHPVPAALTRRGLIGLGAGAAAGLLAACAGGKSAGEAAGVGEATKLAFEFSLPPQPARSALPSASAPNQRAG